MFTWKKTELRRLNRALHRDFGYFFSSLILMYCISGLALNHVNDWNPDFIIHRNSIDISRSLSKSSINDDVVSELGMLVGEDSFKIYDFPTSDKVKIYYENASFLIDMTTRQGVYERISKRPLFYQTNVLHRNSLKGWKWVSDILAVMLIIITVTGFFIMKGKNGISGRGKWLITAGFIPPLLALLIQHFLH